MIFTSAEAAKMLKKVNEQIISIESKERRINQFEVGTNENIEDVRPKYDYVETSKQINELEEKARKLKHAINLFNISTKVDGFDMTVDQMLVYIPQLTKKKSKLSGMADCLEKERIGYNGDGVVEYRYVNYDLDKVKKDLEEIGDTLAKAQTALDVANNSVTFEVDM